MSAHIPTTETTRGETNGACSCGWSMNYAYSGDIPWREQQAMKDAQQHADKENAR